VVVLVVLFIVAVYWFRSSAKHVADDSSETIANVLTPTSVSSAVIAAAQTASRKAVLRDVAGGFSSGEANRATDDGSFSISMKADLPEIDRDAYAYEAWLLRQVPYDYFSVGEFVTNDDGEWVLEWNGAAGRYDAYTQVVVTLEKKDGNSDPSGHVMEGKFE
jgi:hypothetical protein